MPKCHPSPKSRTAHLRSQHPPPPHLSFFFARALVWGVQRTVSRSARRRRVALAHVPPYPPAPRVSSVSSHGRTRTACRPARSDFPTHGKYETFTFGFSAVSECTWTRARGRSSVQYDHIGLRASAQASNPGCGPTPSPLPRAPRFSAPKKAGVRALGGHLQSSPSRFHSTRSAFASVL